MRRLLLAAALAWWGLALPWVSWPGVFPEVAHRVAFLFCAFAVGLLQCGSVRRAAPLPASWQVVLWGAAAVLLWHAWPHYLSADYFEAFVETASLADGLLVLVAGAWALWALRQYPARWLRRLRWVALVCVAWNVLVVVWQRGHGEPTVGWLGLHRCLGVYAVAWAPILMAWASWLIAWPLILVWASGSPVAWVGLGLAAWWVRPRWRGIILAAVFIGLVWGSRGTAYLVNLDDWDRFSRLNQRLETWGPVLRATLSHPLAGWGFGLMAYPAVQVSVGARLPSVHSDWLALALFGGWPLALLVGCVWWRLVRSRPATQWARAVQAGLVSLGIMSAVQGVVSQARILGLAVLLLAWYLVEQEDSCESSAS